MQDKFEAPIGGLNARDSLDNMSPTDAVVFTNWVAEGGYIRSRGGTAIFADDSTLGGVGDAKETIATFDGGGTERILSAFDNGKDGDSLYDVTATPVKLSDGFSNSRWNTMMANGRMILTNGTDDPQVWDGGATTTAATMALLQSDRSTPSLTAASDLWGCTMHQTRGYYWAENDQKFFYTDVAGAFQGDLIEFDLSFVTKQGGSLVNVLSQSLDTGSGLNDIAVFVFSTGECVVYEGSDPGTASDWGLVNRFNIGNPVDIRATTKWGGDNILLTANGMVSIGEVMQAGRVVVEQPTVLNKIVDKATRIFKRFKNNSGWDIHFSSSTGFLLINYTTNSGNGRQVVLNTRTGAWSDFAGAQAVQWTDYNGGLYYAGNAKTPHICQAETGYKDIDDKYIVVNVTTSFQGYGSPGWKKLTKVNVCTNYRHEMRIDAQTNNFRSPDDAINTPNEYFTTKWNESKWNTFKWAGSIDGIDTEPYTRWYPCHGKGRTIAIKLRAMSRTQEIIWYFYELKFKQGLK